MVAVELHNDMVTCRAMRANTLRHEPRTTKLALVLLSQTARHLRIWCEEGHVKLPLQQRRYLRRGV